MKLESVKLDKQMNLQGQDSKCYSVEPVLRCLPGCMPVRTTTVNVGFHCVPAGESERNFFLNWAMLHLSSYLGQRLTALLSPFLQIPTWTALMVWAASLRRALTWENQQKPTWPVAASLSVLNLIAFSHMMFYSLFRKSFVNYFVWTVNLNKYQKQRKHVLSEILCRGSC